MMKCLECGIETGCYGWRDRQPAVAKYGYVMPDDDPKRFEMVWSHGYGQEWETCARYSGVRADIPTEMEDHPITITSGDHRNDEEELLKWFKEWWQQGTEDELTMEERLRQLGVPITDDDADG